LLTTVIKHQAKENIMENNKNNYSSINEPLSLIMVESGGDYGDTNKLYNDNVNVLAGEGAGAGENHGVFLRICSFIDFVGVTCNGNTIHSASLSLSDNNNATNESTTLVVVTTANSCGMPSCM
jgi:hypothetical protein